MVTIFMMNEEIACGMVCFFDQKKHSYLIWYLSDKRNEEYWKKRGSTKKNNFFFRPRDRKIATQKNTVFKCNSFFLKKRLPGRWGAIPGVDVVITIFGDFCQISVVLKMLYSMLYSKTYVCVGKKLALLNNLLMFCNLDICVYFPPHKQRQSDAIEIRNSILKNSGEKLTSRREAIYLDKGCYVLMPTSKIGIQHYLKCQFRLITDPTRQPKSGTRDRCYDFLNIFAEKFSEKIGVFCSNYC
jgi:hypothetical protein